MRDRLSQHTALRGRAVARIAVALLAVLGSGALISDAAAGSSSGPVPYSNLHLDQPGATFSVSSWTTSSNGCTIGEPSTQQSFNAALSSGTGGTGVLTLGFAGGSLSSPVSSTGPGELHFDLKGSSNNGAGTYDLNLTGYGTTFTGTAQLSDSACTYTSSSATLTLDGTGLTIIAPKVSLALNPDTVDACSSSCSSVLATATVTNSSSGQPIAGQSVSFSSSDPNVRIGSVTDHGDGTYTASLEPSEDPGDVTITATDNSATPPASGTATLQQLCQPSGTAPDTGGLATAVAAKRKDCTETRVICGGVAGGVNVIPCIAEVIDKEKHPRSSPSGSVMITLSGVFLPGYGPLPPSTPEACPLKAVRGGRMSRCVFAVANPRITTAATVDVTAAYGGDNDHKTSSGKTTVGLEALVQGPSTKTMFTPSQKQQLALMKNVSDADAYALGVPAVLGAVAPEPIVTKTEAATLGAIALGFKGYSVVCSILKDNIDPFDPHFGAVATPHPGRAPFLGTTALGRTARAFLANELKMSAINSALWTSVNRATSAGQRHDAAARTAQLQAAVNYLYEMASVVDSNIALQRQLARELRAAHIGTVTLSASKRRLLKAELPSGLPRDLARVLTGNLGRTLLTTVRQGSKVRHLPRTLQLAAQLVAPGLIKAERQFAAELRTAARNPVPQAFSSTDYLGLVPGPTVK